MNSWEKIGLCFLCISVMPVLSLAEVMRLELSGPKHPVPVKIYLPNVAAEPMPVVLVSHGLGGSREGSTYLGKHWSAAGYAVVAIQHPGSDESVWKDVPKWRRRPVLKRAASAKSFMNRLSDVTTVLDYIEGSRLAETHPLHNRVDPSRIALSGHSFGAVTSQAIMGQSFRQPSDAPFLDNRIDCVILMSPSPSKHLSNDDAFNSVTLPVLCMTGTEDGSPLQRDFNPESRQQVYAALPEGQAYQIVFDQGAHSIFSDFRNTDHRYQAAIQAVTTVFLDAQLKRDPEALNRLRSNAVTRQLEPEDEWDWK